MNVYQFNGKDIDYERVLDFDEYVSLIKSDYSKESVLNLRNIDKPSNRGEYRKFKHDNLPLFYFNGDIEYEIINRENKNRNLMLINPLVDFYTSINSLNNKRWVVKRGDNSILVLDIDNVDVSEHFNSLKEIPWVHICHITSSGKGFRVIVKTSKQKSLRVQLNFINDEFKRKYGITLDDEMFSDRQLFYSSWDPNVYYNKESILI